MTKSKNTPNSKEIDKIFFWTTNSAYFRRYELTSWYLQLLFTRKLISFNEFEDGEANKLLYIKDSQSKMYFSDIESLSHNKIPNINDTTKNTPQFNESFQITSKSRVIQMCSKYRIVFSIDVSPSMGAIDPKTGKPFFSYVIGSLSTSLKSLSELIKLKTTTGEIILKPEIYVSIIAQSISDDSLIVLIQGVLLSKENVDQIVDYLKRKFDDIEVFAAKMRTKLLSQIMENHFSSNNNSNTNFYQFNNLNNEQIPNFNKENNNLNENNNNNKMKTKELSSILNRAMISLSLLPSDASSRIVIITDGVSIIKESESCDSLITKFNREDISISFIQVAHFDPSSSLGYIPDSG